MKSNLVSKLPGVQEQCKRTLPRTDYSEPKMHGVCNCGGARCLSMLLWDFKGVRRAPARVPADHQRWEPVRAYGDPEWLITERERWMFETR
jgi:hypothetical protein